jgi:hypothetical protein
LKYNDSLGHWSHVVRECQTTFESNPLQAGETPYSLAVEEIDGDKVSWAGLLLGPVVRPRYHIKQPGPSWAVLFSGAPDLTLGVRPPARIR